MKSKWFIIALTAVIFGLGACGGSKDKKSDAKSITEFWVNDIKYTINPDNTIYFLYPKTAENTWAGEPSWPVAPTITFSEKATISPDPSMRQSFIEETVIYTVTAEDGSKAFYHVHAEKAQTIGQ